jgi:hypothetical protein
MQMNGGRMNMLSKTTKIIIAYALGQATQLVLHAMVVSLNLWDNRRIPYCLAGGFVILFAIISGIIISKGQDEKLEQEFNPPKHEKKSYLDYAKVPEKTTEVVNPLGKRLD